MFDAHTAHSKEVSEEIEKVFGVRRLKEIVRSPPIIRNASRC
jgi:hypothetical protein